MLKKLNIVMLALLAGCAAGEASYAPPVWTREYCSSQDWERLGRSDAARFEDAEKRFASLEQACGIHMRLDKAAYMRGFKAGL